MAQVPLQNRPQHRIHELGAIQPYGLVFVLQSNQSGIMDQSPESHNSGCGLTITMVSENIRWYGWSPEALIGEDFTVLTQDYQTAFNLKKTLVALKSTKWKTTYSDEWKHDSEFKSQEPNTSAVKHEIQHVDIRILKGKAESIDVPSYEQLQPNLEQRDSTEEDQELDTDYFNMTGLVMLANRANHYILEIEHTKPSWDNPNYMKTVAEFSEFCKKCTDTQAVCDAGTRLVYEITKFDRVMMYKFDHQFNGEVISESKAENRASSYFGLHFPHTDIPIQARTLYIRNHSRFIADTEAVPVRFHPPCFDGHGLPGSGPQAPRALDLSDCKLRAVSPCHIQYLKNMGVTGSLSMSIVVNDRLWGLLCCHNLSGPYYPNVHLRRAVELLSRIISVQVETNERKREIRALLSTQYLLADLGSRLDIRTYMERYHTSLLQLLHSESIALVKHKGSSTNEFECQIYGRPLGTTDVLMLLDRLKSHGRYEVLFTSNLRSYVPDANLLQQRLGKEPYVLAGACILHCHMYDVLLLREEHVCQIRWGGKPDKEVRLSGPNAVLNPRQSFETFLEITRGHSRHWFEEDLKLCRLFQDRLVLAAHQETLAAEEDARLELEKATQEITAQASKLSLEGAGQELKAPLQGLVGSLAQVCAKAQHAGEDMLRPALLAMACASSLSEVLDDVILMAQQQAFCNGSGSPTMLPTRKLLYDLSQTILCAHKLLEGWAMNSRVELGSLVLMSETGPDIAVPRGQLSPVEWPMLGDPGRVRHLALGLIGSGVKLACRGSTVATSIARSPTKEGLAAQIKRVTDKYTESTLILEDVLVQIEAKQPLSSVQEGVSASEVILEETSQWFAFMIEGKNPVFNPKELIEALKTQTQNLKTTQPSQFLDVGLKNCWHSAEALGGTICIYSAQPQNETDPQGAFYALVFITRLAALLVPNLEYTQTVPESVLASPPHQDFGQKKNAVLVVEDNKVNLKALNAMISRSYPDYTIHAALDGVEAVRAVSQWHSSLLIILMDWQMPGMNGVDATRSIREMEQELGLARVPIIAMGCPLVQDETASWKAAGMDGSIAKPVRTADLVNMLETFKPQEAVEGPKPEDSSFKNVQKDLVAEGLSKDGKTFEKTFQKEQCLISMETEGSSVIQT